MVLNRAKDHYKNDKERLREQARDTYRNASEGDKNESENFEETDIIFLKKENKE